MSNSNPNTQVVRREIENSINLIDKLSWTNLVKEKNIYLSTAYLSAIEKAMDGAMGFYYSISYNKNNEPILISVFQIATYIDKRAHSKNRFKCVVSKAKSKLFTFNVIVCGSVFSDGENGFLCSEEMSKDETISELGIISKEIKKRLKSTNKNASIVLFKEFWANKDSFGKQFKKAKYREFMIDVNMVLPIHQEWKTMDDYLSSLKKKYRSRARTIYKKSDELAIKDLNESDIKKHSKNIDDLFLRVADKSNFSFGRFNAQGFLHLKENLKENFSFRGVFLKEELIGFSSAICNNKIYEANYVGLDYELNADKEIYQRLLYDFIEQAISRQSIELHLGRTSELIKSAIGAVPENMNLYAKHSSRIHNIALKPIFHFIAPSKFELRKPFKTEFQS